MALPSARPGMRVANRSLVLRTVLQHGAVARVELAQATGLTPAAISYITRDLIADGLLREVGMERSRRVGANAILLDLPGDVPLLGAVHQGVSALRVGLCTLRGKVVARRLTLTPERYTPEWAVATIATTLRELAEEVGHPGLELVGVGAGLAGLVDVESGIARRSASLGWSDVPFERLLSSELGAPVCIENNVRAMAYGEALLGSANDGRDFAFVYVGTGIGSGLIVDGKVYHGARGGAGELGHMTVAPDGDMCACGNRGCLETIAAEPAILRHAFQQGVALGDVDPIHRPKAAVRRLVELAMAGDESAAEVVGASGASLGIALANLVDLFNPERIVVHGAITGANDLFLAPVERAMRERAFLAQGDSIALQRPTFGEETGLVGAAAVALDGIVLRGDIRIPSHTTPAGGNVLAGV